MRSSHSEPGFGRLDTARSSTSETNAGPERIGFEEMLAACALDLSVGESVVAGFSASFAARSDADAGGEANSITACSPVESHG